MGCFCTYFQVGTGCASSQSKYKVKCSWWWHWRTGGEAAPGEIDVGDRKHNDYREFSRFGVLLVYMDMLRRLSDEGFKRRSRCITKLPGRRTQTWDSRSPGPRLRLEGHVCCCGVDTLGFPRSSEAWKASLTHGRWVACRVLDILISSQQKKKKPQCSPGAAVSHEWRRRHAEDPSVARCLENWRNGWLYFKNSASEGSRWWKPTAVLSLSNR